MPPQRTGDGWRYVGLELDPVRHEQLFDQPWLTGGWRQLEALTHTT